MKNKNPNHSNGVSVFPPVFEWLIQQGKTDLEWDAPHSTGFIPPTVGPGLENTEKGFNTLENTAKTALQTLSDWSGTDPRGGRAEMPPAVLESFQSLDALSFFCEGAARHADSIDADIREKAGSLLDTLIAASPAPFHRLIPFNDFRRERLREIREDAHFLFPWYTEWSDVPSDTLERVIDHWEEFQRNDWGEINLAPEILRHLSYELEQDAEFRDGLRHAAMLQRNILDAIDQDAALRLLALREWETALWANAAGPAASGIARFPKTAGMVADASSDSGKWEGRFLRAFCGPGLSQGERLQEFQAIAAYVDTHRPWVRGAGGILADVDRFARRELPGKRLGEHCGREPATSRLSLWKPVDAVLQRLVTASGLDLSWPKMQPLVFAAGVSEAVQPKDATRYQNPAGNFLRLPPVFSGEGEWVIPGKEAPDDLRFFLKTRKFYWNIRCWRRDGSENRPLETPQRHDNGRLPMGRVPDDDYAMILVLISDDEDRIIRAMETETLTEEEKRQLLLLLYETPK